ncbi:hypothetical protein [Streptomyces sp. NPDC048710]|uniref:hypothetical protein n=1 Tax=Streptomyces sp. NPDC048710 TaxID=3365586 RepID=UPI0037114F3A
MAPQHSGGASAAVTATRHLGEAIGSAVVAGVLFARLGGSEWTGAAMLRGCTAAFRWAAGCTLLAGLLVTAGRPESEWPTPSWKEVAEGSAAAS